MTRGAIGLLLVLLVAAGGCGGGDGDNSGAAGNPGTTSPAVVSPSPTPATSAPPAATGELCTFLRAEVPKLKAVGSEVGALAQLTADLATWLGENPGERPANTAQLDEITQRECPDVRSDILKTIGASRFADAF